MADVGAIGTGHSFSSRRILFNFESPTLHGKGHEYGNRNPFPHADYPTTRSSGHLDSITGLVSNVKSAAIGTGQAIGIHNILPIAIPIATSGWQKTVPFASRHIQVWSNRYNPTSFIGNPAQLYLTPTPGVISGTLNTGIIIDYNHVVRLYYRPTGYMIDQVRTNIDGSFLFNTDLDKAEVGNYYIIAFDLNNNFNAVVYDLLTPG